MVDGDDVPRRRQGERTRRPFLVEDIAPASRACQRRHRAGLEVDLAQRVIVSVGDEDRFKGCRGNALGIVERCLARGAILEALMAGAEAL